MIGLFCKDGRVEEIIHRIATSGRYPTVESLFPAFTKAHDPFIQDAVSEGDQRASDRALLKLIKPDDAAT